MTWYLLIVIPVYGAGFLLGLGWGTTHLQELGINGHSGPCVPSSMVILCGVLWPLIGFGYCCFGFVISLCRRYPLARHYVLGHLSE